MRFSRFAMALPLALPSSRWATARSRLPSRLSGPGCAVMLRWIVGRTWGKAIGSSLSPSPTDAIGTSTSCVPTRHPCHRHHRGPGGRPGALAYRAL